MFMSNIPRRKIYEEMLVFEDGLIEMQILTFSNDNYHKYSPAFNKEGFPKIKQAYLHIKGLIVMFVQNKKYEVDGGFDQDFGKIITDEESLNKKLNESKALPNKFKKVLFRLDKEVVPLEQVESPEQVKELYEMLEQFNDYIPKILTIRRDTMSLE